MLYDAINHENMIKYGITIASQRFLGIQVDIRGI